MTAYMVEWSEMDAFSNDEVMHDTFATEALADEWVDFLEGYLGDINVEVIEMAAVYGGLTEITDEMRSFVKEIAKVT